MMSQGEFAGAIHAMGSSQRDHYSDGSTFQRPHQLHGAVAGYSMPPSADLEVT